MDDERSPCAGIGQFLRCGAKTPCEWLHEVIYVPVRNVSVCGGEINWYDMAVVLFRINLLYGCRIIS